MLFTLDFESVLLVHMERRPDTSYGWVLTDNWDLVLLELSARGVSNNVNLSSNLGRRHISHANNFIVTVSVVALDNWVTALSSYNKFYLWVFLRNLLQVGSQKFAHALGTASPVAVSQCDSLAGQNERPETI